MSDRLLLVGAGLAHLELLREIARRPLPGLRPTLVGSDPQLLYSGRVPAFLAGVAALSELTIDLRQVAASAGGDFVAGEAVAVDRARREVELASGERIGYDRLSLAVGSIAAAPLHPSVLTLKPMTHAVALERRLREIADAPRAAPAVVAIVGGGAAGVEVALATAACLARGAAPAKVTLIEAGDELLPTFPRRARRLAGSALARAGVGLRLGREARLGADGTLEVGPPEAPERLAAELTIWLGGPAPPPLLRGLALPLDERGFLVVDRALRSPEDPTVFAAGDCASLAAEPTPPKSGASSVRQGPVLARSLRASLLGGRPPRHRPQRHALALLDLADGTALAVYGPLALRARWALHLKRWIDRSFVEKFRQPRPH